MKGDIMDGLKDVKITGNDWRDTKIIVDGKNIAQDLVAATIEIRVGENSRLFLEYDIGKMDYEGKAKVIE
jgi:hypothetical protein